MQDAVHVVQLHTPASRQVLQDPPLQPLQKAAQLRPVDPGVGAAVDDDGDLLEAELVPDLDRLPDADGNVHVAEAVALEVRHPLLLQLDDVVVRSDAALHHLDALAEEVDLLLEAQQRLAERDGQRAVQVPAFPAVDLVRLLLHHEDDVAAPEAGLLLAAALDDDAVPVRGAGLDDDVQVEVLYEVLLPALVASDARGVPYLLLQQHARAVLPRDDPELRPLAVRPLHLALLVVGAEPRDLQLDVDVAPVVQRVERHVNRVDQGLRPHRLLPGPPAAEPEEVGKDVVDVEAVVAAALVEAHQPREAALVVGLPLLRIVQYLVRLVDFLEPPSRVRVLADVGVVLLAQLQEGPPDVLRRGRLGDPEHLVQALLSREGVALGLLAEEPPGVCARDAECNRRQHEKASPHRCVGCSLGSEVRGCVISR
ncbi:TPR-like protein [Babesia caballi]|uniref:TPR-like protein n=1 Tax=Babesia caballi TaxID=5871 RepID=A0AAV4LR50_BABCB|nr:TPR-like protein [Babesia caballi]